MLAVLDGLRTLLSDVGSDGQIDPLGVGGFAAAQRFFCAARHRHSIWAQAIKLELIMMLRKKEEKYAP
jgi:hypothetical protein